MDTATGNDTTNTTNASATSSRATTYDRAQIETDIGNDMSVADIATKHGCSQSLVQDIRRKLANGGEALSRNEQRAAALRKKAAQFKTDKDLLNKWLANDTEEGHVAAIIKNIDAASAALEAAAIGYAELPDTVTTVRRASAKTEFEVGMVVCVKDRKRGNYVGLVASPDHLEVVVVRDTHIAVKDSDGSKVFVPKKDFTARQDA